MRILLSLVCANHSLAFLTVSNTKWGGPPFVFVSAVIVSATFFTRRLLPTANADLPVRLF